MPSLLQFITVLLLIQLADCGAPSNSSIYEILKVNGLPMGLLPKGVKSFSMDDTGKFEVHLDRACNARFENQLHYDVNVTGKIRFGQIDGLLGVSAQELFLWFPVIEIRVDIPSSGLIYFNVGVVSKQLSLSSFETPRDCLDGLGSDLRILDSISKIQYGEHSLELDQQ